MLTAVQTGAGTATSIEVIGDGCAFAALRQEWTRLLAASKSDCLFLTWEWLYTWWRHLAGESRLRLLAVRSDNELIAIAPFAISPRFRFGHPLEALEFLGSGHAGSDYLDIIAKEGCECITLATLSDYLARQPYALRWCNVKPDALAAGLAERLHRSQWSMAHPRTNICPYITLSGLTWEAYLTTLSAEHRYNFRRKWQRLNRDYTVRWETPRKAGECREAIDAAIALHNLRWSGRRHSDALHTPALVAFHRDFVPLAFERGWLRMYILRLDDRPAACLYGLLYGGKFYFYQSGFDPAYAKHSLGFVAMGLAIRDALDDGAREFDLLHGNESYKSHWTRAHRELTRFELFPANAVGRLSHISVDWARSVRRMALGVLNTGQ